MRTSVSDPAGPDVATATEGDKRSRAGTSGSPSRSSFFLSTMVALAGLRASCSGAREAVITIWSVSMGVTGMRVLLLTNLPSQRDAPPVRRCLAHAPPLDPARETDDRPGQVPDLPAKTGSQLRAQRRI